MMNGKGKGKGKARVVPAIATKAYKDSSGVATLIPNLGIRWKWVKWDMERRHLNSCLFVSWNIKDFAW